jgi:hypothetical protein
MKETDINSGERNLDYDAETLKEEISQQKPESPSVNVEKDYEQSKRFSTAEKDLSPEDITPSLGNSFDFENTQSEGLAEGNPEKFLSMAQEIDPKSEK